MCTENSCAAEDRGNSQGNFSSMELFHPKEAEPEEAEIFGKSVKGFQLFLADEKNWQALQKTIPQNLR